MFSSSSVKYDEFPSLKREQRITQVKSTQTRELETSENEAQFPLTRTIAIQTDVEKFQIRFKTLESEEELESFAAFLRRVSPLICSQLERNYRNTAFTRYNERGNKDSGDTQPSYRLIHVPFLSQLECSALSWNSTGNSLAVGYSFGLHSDWCVHDSAVCIWNLQSKDFNTNKPNMSIEVDSCISALEFHPHHPARLVVGKFNGEILYWDTSRDDDILMSSTAGDLGSHREPITSLSWSSDLHGDDSFFSSSLDGKIFIWKYNEKTKALEVQDRFVILAGNLPRHLGIKSSKADAEVGVTSLSVNSQDPSIFLIGTEGGGIFQCSVNSQHVTNYSAIPSVQFKNPIMMSFLPHQGSTSTVNFSLHARNLFLTCGTDGELRVYTLLQPKPLITFNFTVGLASAQWSQVRPLVIVGIRDDNTFVVCDILATTSSAIFSSSPESEHAAHGSIIRYNPSNHKYACTGSSDGSVQVWQLGASLLELHSKETEHLQELAAGVTE